MESISLAKSGKFLNLSGFFIPQDRDMAVSLLDDCGRPASHPTGSINPWLSIY
jgi:hypothetical protein